MKYRIKSLIIAFAVLVMLLFCAGVVAFAEGEEAETTPVSGREEPQQKQGLVNEDGKMYYYIDNENYVTNQLLEIETDGVAKYYYFQKDGTAFTDGYKPLEIDGKRTYYYFQADGSAYTDGYLSFEQGGKKYYFFFKKDGKAFTDGYKEIDLNGKTCYFYFLSNGQGFNTGYKTVMINGKKYYFYFGSDGKAVTDKVQSVTLGERKAYFRLTENGRAYTDGYLAVKNGDKTNYYYFLQNGQAYTGGYKVVKNGDKTDYYFFQSNGTAYTKGKKKVAFGDNSFYYYFGENGKAAKSAWREDGYYLKTGRAITGRFATISKKKYYFDSAGKVKKNCWFSVSSAYYYADDTGALKTNTVVEGYKLDSAGKSMTKYRIHQIVKQHTDSDMSDQAKINALYNFIITNKWTYIRNNDHLATGWKWKDGWTDDYAVRLMDEGGGNCFAFASFFGFAVRDATGLDVRVYRGTSSRSGVGTPHAWIAVQQSGKWYAYDPELAKFADLTHPEYCKKYPYPSKEDIYHQNGTALNLY